MPHSTRRPTRKPKKPRPDYPLFAHGSGVWAKKIRGKMHYFGPWRDPDAALKRYLDVKDDLHAGRRPRARRDGFTVRDACNHFLTARQRKLDAGEMTRRSWLEYHADAATIIEAFGANRLVDDLTPTDFGELRARLAKGRGAECLGNHVQRVRTLFKFIFDSGLIDRPARIGPEFKRPSRAIIRKARQSKPAKLFDAAEIRAMLDIASVPMRAMILLATNAGMGNSDCSELPQTALDFKRGVMDFPRSKTAIERRATLWAETIEAVQEAIRVRPDPKDKADAGLVFITQRGQRWVKYRDRGLINSVSLEFGKLKKTVGVEREGCGFYGLRHTFATVAGETGDQAAVNRIMGHEDPSMAGIYREWRKDKREDERLRRVTDHVRAWLYGAEDVE